jgi:RNAse (barnase) inhibitor barstar
LKRCVTTGREVCHEITEDIFGLKSYFDRIMLDAQNTKHYLDLTDSMTLLRHMQVEFLDLVDKIAFDSITDVKFFEEVKKQLEKKFHILLQGRSLRNRHNQAKQKKNHRL